MTDTFVQQAPKRLCDSCLVVDQDPRHVYGDERGQIAYTDEQRKSAFDNAEGDTEKLTVVMRDMSDDGTQVKHMDCCLADGCPDGSCQRALDDKDHPFDGGKTTGVALSKKLVARVEALTKNQEN